MTQPAPRDDADDRSRFDEIVAQLQNEPWPEPDPEPKPDSPPEAQLNSMTPSADAPDADPLASLPSQWRVPSTESSGFLEEESTDYVPDDPEPLPAGDLSFWGALAGLVGGPLWLLYLFFFDRYASGLWWVLACAATIGGLLLMFMRQPERRDDDWNDDVDGAVL